MNEFRKVSKLSLLLICFIFLSKSSARDFPIKIGNMWSYNVSHYTGNHYTKNVEVIGDTVLGNGIKYFVLNHSDFSLSNFIRADSGFIYYYNPYDSIDVKMFGIEDTIGQTRDINYSYFFSVRLKQRAIESVFGVQTEIYEYDLDGLAYGVILISWELGRLLFADFGDPPVLNPNELWELSGCVLSDTTYGIILDTKDELVTINNFQLFQNYPNPFNPSTKIRFEIPYSTNVKIDVYDLLGRKVQTLLDDYVDGGSHELEFNADNLTSGIYFYSLKADGYSETKKLSLIR